MQSFRDVADSLEKKTRIPKDWTHLSRYARVMGKKIETFQPGFLTEYEINLEGGHQVFKADGKIYWISYTVYLATLRVMCVMQFTMDWEIEKMIQAKIPIEFADRYNPDIVAHNFIEAATAGKKFWDKVSTESIVLDEVTTRPLAETDEELGQWILDLRKSFHEEDVIISYCRRLSRVSMHTPADSVCNAFLRMRNKEPAAKAWHYERQVEAAYSYVTGKVAPMNETDWVKDFEAVKSKLLQRDRTTKCECCGAIGRWLEDTKQYFKLACKYVAEEDH